LFVEVAEGKKLGTDSYIPFLGPRHAQNTGEWEHRSVANSGQVQNSIC